MSVIIRLQGLPWTASAMNIRHFFSGLNIPAGGVHIIGGEGGDAFIAFSSDEDARVAMKMNMSALNGVPVQLFLSSKSEMQSVIEAARSGPGTAASAAPVPAVSQQQQQNNMAAAAGMTPGVNANANNNSNMNMSAMGGMQQPQQQQQTGNNMGMAGHNNMAGGYPGMMQGQGMMQQQPNAMMGQQKGGNFQQNMYGQQSDGSNAASIGGGNNYTGGMSGSGNTASNNQWQQGYGGMGMGGMQGTTGAQGENTLANQNINQNQNPNMNTNTNNSSMNMATQFQQHSNNQNMMGGYGGANDQYGNFQNMKQQGSNDSQYPTQQQGGMMGGRQDQSMMGMGQGQNRYNADVNSGQRQYPGMKTDDGSGGAGSMGQGQGFMPSAQGQRGGSMGKDKDTTSEGASGLQTGRDSMRDERGGSGYGNDRFGGADQMGARGGRVSRWGAEKSSNDGYGDQNQYPPESRGRDNRDGPWNRQGMGRDDGQSWNSNRFGEEDNMSQGSGGTGNDRFGRVGMNRPDGGGGGFPERDARMPGVGGGQFPGGFRGRPDQLGGRLPPQASDRPLGRFGGSVSGSDRGSVKDDDGIPSTKYPPDDDEPMGGMMSGVGGGMDEFRRMTPGGGAAGRPPMPPDTIKDTTDDGNQRSNPDIRTGRDGGDRRNRPRISRFDRDEKGMPVDQPLDKPASMPGGDDSKNFPSTEGRGFPPGNNAPRFPPDNRYGDFPNDNNRLPSSERHSFPEGDMRGMHGGDDVGKYPGQGDDRMSRGAMGPGEDRFGRLGQEDSRDRMDRPYSGERMGGRPIPGDRLNMNRPMGDEERDRMGGRSMPDDRFGRPGSASDDRFGDERTRLGRDGAMWPEDRGMADDMMMRRRRGDGGFGGGMDDPAYHEMDDREGFDYERGRGGHRGGYGMRGGRGGMRGMGRPGENRPYPPDWRDREGDFPTGGMRGDEGRGFPYRHDDRYPDDRRWNRGSDDVGGKQSDVTEDGGGGPFDMDQRFDHKMRGGAGRGRWPPSEEMYGDEQGGAGGGYGMEGEMYGRGRGSQPRDFDSRPGGGMRGGGMMMDRGPRGRGEPFGRGGRGGGMPPFGRGRGDLQSFEGPGPMGQDVDNRSGRPDGTSQPPFPDRPNFTGGRGLLGEAPAMPTKAPPATDSDNAKKDTSLEKKEFDNKDAKRSSPRRSGDRDRGDRDRGRDRDRERERDRDRRHYDDRRGSGRDRDDRDRYTYRDRFGRDRELRERDRRRSRSRSRDRSDRDRDSSRYNRQRDDAQKSDRNNKATNKSDTNLTTSTTTTKGTSSTPTATTPSRPTRFLQLKDMPKTISFRDIRKFFHPMEIPFDGIKLINDKDGNRVGDAFIYFHRLDDATKAQKRSGEKVEGRAISISFTTEDEFEKAIDSFVPKKTDTSAPNTPRTTTTTAKPSAPTTPSKPTMNEKKRYIVNMKNMPLTVTRQEIRSFFQNLKIDNNGEAAYIEFDQNGVATGIGFVEFVNEMDYKKALTQNCTMLGGNKVNVFQGAAADCDKLKSVQGEMFQRAALRSIANKTGMNVLPNLGTQNQQPVTPNQQPSTGPPPPINPPADAETRLCVHIQGLPLLATHHDIRDFFTDCNIAPRGINIAHDGNGKPLGEGFVEFMLQSDVEKAMKKDKTSLGRHIVAVKLISKKEMIDRLEGARHRGGVPPKMPPTTQTSQQQGGQIPPSITSIFPKPPTNPNPTPMNQQPQQQPPPMPSLQQQRQPTPQQPLQSQGPRPQQQQPGNQGPPRPQQPGGPMPPQQPPQPNQQPPRPPQQQQQQQQQAPSQQSPLLQTPNQGPAPNQGPPPMVVAPGGGKSFPPGVLNANWFYVRCQNFPQDISIGEIMQFFQGFRPIGESIRLHYSSEGHPTGNAVVGFGACDDANRALQRLHMSFCRHNTVNIHPA